MTLVIISMIISMFICLSFTTIRLCFEIKRKNEMIDTMTKINEDWANEVLRLTRELERTREL